MAKTIITLINPHKIIFKIEKNIFLCIMKTNMSVMSKVKNKVMSKLGLVKVNSPLYGERLTFVNDDEAIRLYKVKANKVWANGDASEKLNFYTNQISFGFFDNPFYNRNELNLFWSISAREQYIKRTSSDFANSIINTISNVCGVPQITFENEEYQKIWEEIAKVNDFNILLSQDIRTNALITGTSVAKINFDTNFMKMPIIENVDAENVSIITNYGQIIAIIFKTFYQYKDNDYVLFETRRKDQENSYIEYELFKKVNTNEIKKCDLSEVPDTSKFTNLVFKGVHEILGVPFIYFKNPIYKNYGKGVLEGKFTELDNLDQAESVASWCVRVSTPIEYYSEDVLERRNKNGIPSVPSAFNRQYVKKETLPNGDGEVNDPSIITTQPHLDIAQYQNEIANIKLAILDGLISPATMGMDMARNNNALAQREKEKITISTRNAIIKAETEALKKLIKIAIATYKFLNSNGVFYIDDEMEINIKYNEFANPSFENELPILGNAWNLGQISTEKYVELLWGDKISDKDKAKEIAYLEKNRMRDNLDMGEFELEDVSKKEDTTNIQAKERTEK